MHYHSAQHGEPRLHRAARSQHGETQLPSSTSLPEQPVPLQSASAPAVGASDFERMQAELKAMHQQALATQQSLQQLQARKPADPYSAVVSELTGFAAGNGTLLGVGVGMSLALAGVAVWWFVWQRPRNRGPVSHATRPKAATPVSAPAPLPPSDASQEATEDWAFSTAPGEFSTNDFESAGANARLDRDKAFDSEAAAAEVTRVRKSLADKRDARAHFLEREEAYDPDRELDLDLDVLHATSPTHAPLAGIPVDAAIPEPLLEVKSGLERDPWLQPGEALPGTTDDPNSEAIHFSLALDDYGVKPETPTTPDTYSHHELAMNLVSEVEIEVEADTIDAPPLAHELEAKADPLQPESGVKGYDFTITMALAEESAALELWTEARDLANEVLTSDNAALRNQARDLLERIHQLENDAPPDTNWGTVR